jgi:hypothetical protein
MRTWIKILLGLTAVGIIAAFLLYHFLYNKPHPDYTNMESAYSVTAGELYKAYISDKTEAGKKFNGKVIAVAGKLSKVEASDSVTVCVFVFNQGMFGDEGVRCTMSAGFSEQARKFQPDGEVRLKGYCTGFNDTDVILDKCSIEKQ